MFSMTSRYFLPLRYWRYISLVHQSRWSRFQSGSFSNVLALFVIVVVMSESREEAGPLPQLQDLEKSLKELRPLEVAKSAILLHFGLHVVEAKLVNVEEVECWHCGAALKHIQWHHY